MPQVRRPAGLEGIFDMFRSVSLRKPPHLGEATTVWLGLRSGSTPRKNGSSARVLAVTADIFAFVPAGETQEAYFTLYVVD